MFFSDNSFLDNSEVSVAKNIFRTIPFIDNSQDSVAKNVFGSFVGAVWDFLFLTQ